MYYQVSQTEGNFERCQVEKMKKKLLRKWIKTSNCVSPLFDTLLCVTKQQSVSPLKRKEMKPIFVPSFFH